MPEQTILTWKKIIARLVLRSISTHIANQRLTVNAVLYPAVKREGFGFLARKEVIRCLMVQQGGR
ncbi:hypothetical protein EB810_07080 [Altererythrobacter sp. FM1]|nr:hypothetical protein EB810_07080 [Altererythrobacter sp. FM1]